MYTYMYIYVYMYVCMHACMYVCMYACMLYVCMYVYIYIRDRRGHSSDERRTHLCSSAPRVSVPRCSIKAL